MLMSVFLLVAVLSGESFATKAWVERLKSSTKVEAVAPSRRNLKQFKEMIECTTGKSAWKYIDYGCWCGTGGKGKVVDEVDQCCNTHDKCYDKIRKSKACGWPYHWAPYAKTYKWSKGDCSRCAPRNDYKTKEEADCKYELCVCDLNAAKCFKTAKYNIRYFNYPQKDC